MSTPTLPSSNNSTIWAKTRHDVVFTDGNGNDTIIAPADWKEKAYYLTDSVDCPVGIYMGAVDNVQTIVFTLYQPNHRRTSHRMIPLEAKEIDLMDYDTHVAFETYPVLVEHRFTPTSILLKFPE